MKINVPEGCTARIEQENGLLIVSFEQKEKEKSEEWEPKDGDIIAFGNTPDSPSIGIFKMDNCDTFISYATICSSILSFYEPGWVKNNLRPATDSEKQRLFDALTKAGKRWNAEKKCIENLPRWRAEMGGYYFYLSPNFISCRGQDCYMGTHNEFYSLGNYFRTHEASEKVATQIREIFKNSKAE